MDPFHAISTCSKIIVFTGAGMSTESGISDYRSKGGLWERYHPVTIQEFLADEEQRKEYWRRKKEIFPEIQKARPHQGHRALVRLQRQKKLLGVITQNIDGLHQKSGIEKVLELHGTNLEAICLDCKTIFPFEEIYSRLLKDEVIPLCKVCGGLVKANTISFGQSLDGLILREAIQWTRKCNLMLAIGSTLIVEPAASLPLYAKESGAKLIIINRDPTPIDRLADACLRTSIAETLDQIIPEG